MTNEITLKDGETSVTLPDATRFPIGYEIRFENCSDGEVVVYRNTQSEELKLTTFWKKVEPK